MFGPAPSPLLLSIQPVGGDSGLTFELRHTSERDVVLVVDVQEVFGDFTDLNFLG